MKALEKRHRIKVLYAVESGSRAWGFESRDSDYDVRFIYRRPPEMYLAIDDNNLPVEQSDTISLPIEEGLDISGWDLRKTLRLLRKSNPPLLEWLRSPIIYHEEPAAVKRLRALAKRYYSPRACLYHYLHMARGNFRQYLDKPVGVIRKKYLYALRPVLACLWILERKSAAPMETEALIAGLERLKGVRSARESILKLIAEKKAGTELGRGPKDSALDKFLRSALGRIEEALRGAPVGEKPGSEPLNSYFRWVLKSF